MIFLIKKNANMCVVQSHLDVIYSHEVGLKPEM